MECPNVKEPRDVLGRFRPPTASIPMKRPAALGDWNPSSNQSAPWIDHTRPLSTPPNRHSHFRGIIQEPYSLSTLCPLFGAAACELVLQIGP
jgi:hypothetical protein